MHIRSPIVGEIPSNLTKRTEYSNDKRLLYEGYAVFGTLESQEKWFIYKYEYDVSKNEISRKIATERAWTKRALAEYF